jgi:hypothetical protein
MYINTISKEIGLLITENSVKTHPDFVFTLLVNGTLVNTTMFCWKKIEQ